MALTVAELNTKLTADIRDLQNGLKKAQDDVRGFESTGSASIAKFGNLAKLGFAAAGAAALAFAKQSVEAASSLSEALNKSNVIFGQNAAAIEAWAQGAADDFGLSKRAALDAAGSFGNMFTQLGVGTEDAAKMSTKITELAADFASFHNANIEDVIVAQSAAFRGEYDALQRFLPLINAAAVEQKALEMTGKKSTTMLTAQDKALAVNALMFEGAGAAAGDFDRTSDGLANQQRTLAANIENTQAIIGEKLQPVMLQVVQWLNSDGIPGFLKFIEVVGEGMADAGGFFIGAMADIASAVGQTLEKIDQFVPGLEGVPEQILRGVDRMREMESSLHDVSIEMKFATNATSDHKTAQEGAGRAIQGTGLSARQTAQALKDLREAQIAAKDAAFALEDAQLAAADAQKTLDELIKSGGVDAEKLADAQRDLATANGNLAEANDKLVDAQENYNDALAEATERHLEDVRRATDDLREAQEKLAEETQDVADAEGKLSKLKAQRQARDEAIKNATAQLAAADTVTERMIAQEALSKALGMEIVTDQELAAAQQDVAVQQGEVEGATKDVLQAQKDLNTTQQEAPEQTDAVKNAAERLTTAQGAVKTATDNATAAQNALNAAQQPAPGFADAVRGAQRELERANWDVEKATWAAHDAQKAYNEQLNSAPKNITTTVTRNEVVNTTTVRSESARSGAVQWVSPTFVGPLTANMARLPKTGPYTPDQAAAARMLGLPVLHQGGIVPGPMGADVPIMAQAGERVIPADEVGKGGGQPIIVQLVADGRVIQEILLAHQRRSGSLGFN